MLVKICGHTTEEDLHLSADAGADYVGVIVGVPWSPRSVAEAEAGQLFAAARGSAVLVTVDQPLDHLLQWVARWRPAAVQLHGHEPPDFVAGLVARAPQEVWKALGRPPADEPSGAAPPVELRREYEDAGIAKLLVDTAVAGRSGGTGLTSDWSAARALVEAASVPVLLAGGLTPENVAAAVAAAQPAGVDVAGGVEASPGRKDRDRVLRFLAAARAASPPSSA